MRAHALKKGEIVCSFPEADSGKFNDSTCRGGIARVYLINLRSAVSRENFVISRALSSKQLLGQLFTVVTFIINFKGIICQRPFNCSLGIQ